MNLSQANATLGINAMIASFNGGTVTIYSGTQPASPETALSGNTALVAGGVGATGNPVAASSFGTGSISSEYTYGNPGAASSFGTLVTAGGGLGGTSTNAAVCVLGGGGGSLPTVATGVTILSAKQGNCSENWAIAAAGGKGANSSVGEGGQGAINTAPLLANATSGGIGAGGGGGTNTGSASSEQGGGSGGEGYCIIFEYK